MYLNVNNGFLADYTDLDVSQAQFSVDLYKKLAADGQKEVFFSPVSIAVALAMTYAGADGNTRQQMKDVLFKGRKNICEIT